MIKIAFFDVDGTLLKVGSKEPSKNTILALKQLKENGVLLCMATGRSYPSIPRFKDIEFDVWLTFNGSYVRNENHVIFRNPLDVNDKEIIINNLKIMNRVSDGTLWEGQTALYFPCFCLPDGTVVWVTADCDRSNCTLS